MPNALGIGVDIERISRFSGIDDRNSQFLSTFLTQREVAYCYSKENPSPHIAARFVAKEAIIKALGSLAVRQVSFKDIEISNDEYGTPSASVRFGGNLNIHVEISLSHGGDYAVAFAVATKGVRA